jgi:hypothetical protein
MPDSKSGADLFTSLVALAWDYGPAFFALFFLVYVWKGAQNRYNACAVRKDPLPTASELSL